MTITLDSSPRTLAEFVSEVNALMEEIIELYLEDDRPFVVGVSWGKDSTAVLQLVWTAMSLLPPYQRHKPVYVITTDTGVENPYVSVWVRQCIEQVKRAATEQEVPVNAHLLKPALEDSFWVCLIGKGYAAPRNGFRWCTNRLKIKPSNAFIKEKVGLHQGIILLLGTRRAESLARGSRMERAALGQERPRLVENTDLFNSLTYTPIEAWSNEEVWMFLLQWKNPWRSHNRDLLALYRGATADNECPLVVDSSTPSCGSSRFGCYVCTVVSKDRSMEAMIANNEEKEWMQPLLDLRNDLDKDDDRSRRDFRRMSGKVDLYEKKIGGKLSMEPTPGPYTKVWREHWLRRVLEAQQLIRATAPPDVGDIQLIGIEELRAIRRIWVREKHEFDDSLPRIYQEVVGELFPDNLARDRDLLKGEEWDVLRDICNDDPMFFELMTKLLSVEQRHATQVRRAGIYQELEACFNASSRSKEEAIADARQRLLLKSAAQAGQVRTVKQMTWAALKFPQPSEPR